MLHDFVSASPLTHLALQSAGRGVRSRVREMGSTPVIGGGGGDWRALRAPVRQQLVQRTWFQHIARQDVRAWARV